MTTHGRRKVSITDFRVTVQQILPKGPCPEGGVQPPERVTVPSDAQVIRTESWIRNDVRSNGKNEIGWGLATYHDARTTAKEVLK